MLKYGQANSSSCYELFTRNQNIEAQLGTKYSINLTGMRSSTAIGGLIGSHLERILPNRSLHLKQSSKEDLHGLLSDPKASRSGRAQRIGKDRGLTSLFGLVRIPDDLILKSASQGLAFNECLSLLYIEY